LHFGFTSAHEKHVLPIEDVGLDILAAVLWGKAYFVAVVSSDRVGFLRTTF